MCSLMMQHYKVPFFFIRFYSLQRNEMKKKTVKYIVTPIFSEDIANFIILQSDWLSAFWLKIQKPEFSVMYNLQRHIANNVNFQST